MSQEQIAPLPQLNGAESASPGVTSKDLAAVDPGMTRIDLTGYAIPLFDATVRVLEPPAPRRDEEVARIVELQIVTAEGKILSFGANRNMLIALGRAVNKTLRVGDEYYGVKAW